MLNDVLPTGIHGTFREQSEDRRHGDNRSARRLCRRHWRLRRGGHCFGAGIFREESEGYYHLSIYFVRVIVSNIIAANFSERVVVALRSINKTVEVRETPSARVMHTYSCKNNESEEEPSVYTNLSVRLLSDGGFDFLVRVLRGDGHVGVADRIINLGLVGV